MQGPYGSYHLSESVLHVKMLKHDWYVIMSSDYQTSRHEFSLIKI